MSLLPFIESVVERRSLSTQDAEAAMHAILSGAASQPQIAAFLTAMRMKGETADELAGFARAMRGMATRVEVGLDDVALIDTCGTGGDKSDTFNISTIAAFVVAGCGVRVAKHGNRSISSRCGSADLLEAMGIRIAITPEQSARAIREVGIGFLFAPAVHTAMKHAQPVRVDLKMRTVFNLLGPLTNPAGASAQLVGAPSELAAELMANALVSLGLKHGFVVHGSDGLDEITTTGPTHAWEINGGPARRLTLTPDDFGVPQARPEDLKGGDVEANRQIAAAVLSGAAGPKRDIVLANASAALVAAGMADNVPGGAKLAAISIDSGAAQAKADALARFTCSL
jgi:anthranilate phosphoribosyltransferase